MNIFSWEEAQTLSKKNLFSAATIGVFDGLHKGHQALIKKVVSNKKALDSLVFTFKDNPKKRTNMMDFHGNLFTLSQKISALEEMNICHCVLIDFSYEFSRINGTDFVSNLVKLCGVRSFIVGNDFKCGHNEPEHGLVSINAGELISLANNLGADCEIVSPVPFEGQGISSSRIRTAIRDGRTDLALAMLGRPYTLDLNQLETTISTGSYCIDLCSNGLVVPASGVYQAELHDGNNYKKLYVSVNKKGIVSWNFNEQTPFCYKSLSFGSKIE